jgi:hypothetical protein
MADSENPNPEREREWQGQDPPPTDPNQPRHERPMDDPGRGHGDKFEPHLPGREKEDPGSTPGQNR